MPPRELSRSPYQIGQPFNPWRGACGFYIPDLVSRLGPIVILGTRRKLSHGHKRLYTLLVRRWGREGPCYPGQGDLVRELACSERAVRMWIEDLEAFGLILRRHRGRGKGGAGQPDEYSFLWHPIFDRQEWTPPIFGRDPFQRNSYHRNSASKPAGRTAIR